MATKDDREGSRRRGPANHGRHAASCRQRAPRWNSQRHTGGNGGKSCKTWTNELTAEGVNGPGQGCKGDSTTFFICPTTGPSRILSDVVACKISVEKVCTEQCAYSAVQRNRTNTSSLGRQRRVQDGGRSAAPKDAENESRARVRSTRDSEKSTESGESWKSEKVAKTKGA